MRTAKQNSLIVQNFELTPEEVELMCRPGAVIYAQNVLSDSIMDCLKLLALVRIKAAEHRLKLDDAGESFDAESYEMLSESIMSTLKGLLTTEQLGTLMIEMMEAVAEDPTGVRTKEFLDNIINKR